MTPRPCWHDEPCSAVVEPLTRTDFVRFAGASGDFNPVHHDETYARAHGFPSVFAMGMLVAGILADFVVCNAGIAYVRELQMRFRSPIWPGDRLRLAASARDQDRVDLVVTVDDSSRVSGSAVLGDLSGAARPAAADAGPAEEHRELATVRLPVERGQIVQFARAIKSSNEIHHTLDAAHGAGFADLVAPLLFTCTAAHWNGGDAADLVRQVGLDLARVVHGEHAWRFQRPVVAGDLLEGRRWAGPARTVRSRSGKLLSTVAVVTHYSDAQGAPVLAEQMTLIQTPACTLTAKGRAG